MSKNAKQPQNYLGDQNLPTPDATFEYTPKMVKELKKCKEKIDYFAENYFYITSLDRGKETITLYPAQKRVLKSLDKNRFVVLLSSRQAGKCVCGDSKITIRNKNTGKIEEISINDFYERIKSRQTEKRVD